jgi:hypothetical protein
MIALCDGAMCLTERFVGLYSFCDLRTPPECAVCSSSRTVSTQRCLPAQLQTESLQDALRQLFVIGAINCDGAITARGRLMATLPLDPSLAAAALAAADLGCLQDLLTVAAMLSADAIFAGGRCGPASYIGAALFTPTQL